MGGRVKFIVTGSAPLESKVIDFLKIAFSCPLLEAYGQSEGTGLEFGTTIDDNNSAGHVGGPTVVTEFKLVDVPELEYLSTDKDENGNLRPRGEIWVRGLGIVQGYYKKTE